MLCRHRGAEIHLLCVRKLREEAEPNSDLSCSASFEEVSVLGRLTSESPDHGAGLINVLQVLLWLFRHPNVTGRKHAEMGGSQQVLCVGHLVMTKFAFLQKSQNLLERPWATDSARTHFLGFQLCLSLTASVRPGAKSILKTLNNVQHETK